MRFVSPGRLMGIYSAANVVLVTIGITHPGWLGMWAIFLTSFFFHVANVSDNLCYGTSRAG